MEWPAAFFPYQRDGIRALIQSSHLLLGDDMGGLACVGTAVAMRDCGIGTALCARATEILQQRGVGYSHVGWTWLLEFYGRLGYQPWREYRMSWQDLLENPGGSRRERP